MSLLNHIHRCSFPVRKTDISGPKLRKTLKTERYHRHITRNFASLGPRISNLDGFFSRIKECNKDVERKNEFVPLKSGAEVLGYVHQGFLEKLQEFNDVFSVETSESGSFSFLALNSNLRSLEDRTRSVNEIMEILYQRKVFGGWRNELFPVSAAFQGLPYFLLERAAVPYFGIKAYGVHVNGYVRKNGEIFLWVAIRSQTKSTYPGRLDHIVAGGLPHGLSCEENVIKEAQEEAGIPPEIASKAVSVGAVSYETVVGPTLKRDLLFCYDLELPPDFVPRAMDGEVESFSLLPISEVAHIVQNSTQYKSNCTLVIIDFLVRHGYITPDQNGYLALLKGLRQGDYS